MNKQLDDKLKTILAELRQRLAEHYGDRLVEVVLFGSQARGDAVPGSDIDVLVVLRGGVDSSDEIPATSGIIADLSLKHDVLISVLFDAEKDFQYAQSPLMINIRREGIRV